MDPNLPANPNPPQPTSEPQIFAGVTPSSGLLNGENTKINTGVIEAVNPQISQQMLSQAKHPAPIPVENNMPQTNQPFFEAPQQVPTVKNPNQADLYPMQYEPIPVEQRTAPIFPTTPSAIPTVANSTPEQAVIAVTPQELPQSATQALDPVETEEQHERFEQKKIFTQIQRAVHTVVTIVLILQGLYGLFKAIRFIFVEFPIFEQALEDQHLGEETVNQFALQAGIMIFSTAVSMFFAVQMAIFHRKVIKTLNIIVGILVTIGSYYAMKYATSIDVLQLINLAPQRLLP